TNRLGEEERTVHFSTSDGAGDQCVRAWSLIDGDMLPTGNGGSRIVHNCEQVRTFEKEFSKKWPLMCMEVCDGWCDGWGEAVSNRDSDDLAEEVRDAEKLG
ncbi:beta-galactosidase, partial [Staphylococcus pseudintermedius]|uniref:beta-galactosidase n=1 Tax=Staphylococcus pseudintermedius TaxID=283734 RepID=UPI000E366370